MFVIKSRMFKQDELNDLRSIKMEKDSWNNENSGKFKKTSYKQVGFFYKFLISLKKKCTKTIFK